MTGPNGGPPRDPASADGRAARLAGLSPEQLARLHERVRSLRAGGGGPERIPRRPGSGPAPLSFAQQRIWLQHEVEPDAAAFNLSLALRLAGTLDRAVLGRALDEIVRRHEVLRTRFELGEDGPVQVVLPPGGVELRVDDLSGAAAPRDEALRRARAEAAAPFDLRLGAPLRARLFRTGPAEHVLLLALHHVAVDRWSFGILLGELVALYRALAAGAPPPLPELPVQYADFAVWQRRRLSGEALDEQVAFWRRHLDGAPRALELPTDAPRSTPQPFRPATQRVRIPAACAEGIRRAALAEGATPYMVLLGAWGLLLREWCGEDEVVVGSLVANRTHPGTEQLLGTFANTLALRVRPPRAGSFRGWLRELRETMLEAHRHQELPFERVVEALNPEREPGRTPLFQTALNLQKAPLPALDLPGLEVEVLPVQSGAAGLDLYLALEETEDGIVGGLEFNAHLLDGATAALLADAYASLLDAVAGHPGMEVAAWTLPAALRARAEAAIARQRPATLVVAATFTAEPLEAPLAFWSDVLELPLRVEFAPYNQVLQQLLDPGSALSRGADGAGVVLVRLEDRERYTARGAGAPDLARVAESVGELAEAVRAAAERARAPLLLGVCPASPAALARPGTADALGRLEEELARGLAGLPGVHVLRSREMLAACGAEDPHDPGADAAGHIPYTGAFFAALGTLLARRLHALRRTPAKVLALDCDGVLWKGVCAEDGPDGVEVDPARRAFQERVVELQRAGTLVCLCSRNREEDVLEVLRRGDMVLRREHLVDWRVNWLPKPENLRSLAESLGLGLDSFVFVDDDPVVCAGVRAACPEVVTLPFPADRPDRIPAFAANLWALDRAAVTGEDRRRTEMYRENADRERLRRGAPTLEAFLAGLELCVEAAPARPEQHARLAQLTQRTNQFNASARRRSEDEVRAWAADSARGCLAVQVSDRFGDYGLAGAALYAPRGGALEVDTLLLSCRVLGRGVEHRVMAELGRRAREAGCSRVEVPYVAGPRSEPVRAFLEEVGERVEDARGVRYVLGADAAEACRPRAGTGADGERAPASGATPSAAAAGGERSARYERIAGELADPALLLRAVREARRVARRGAPAEYAAPRTPLEASLAELWAGVLGVERVGVHDDFFALGGHSVLGAVLVGRVRAALGAELPLAALFDAPTVARMAAALERTAEGTAPAAIPRIPRSPGAAFPLSPAQQQLWLVDQLGEDRAAYNVPLALRLEGELDPELLERAVAAVVERHEALRTRFELRGGEPVQVVQADARVPLRRADLGALPPEERVAAAFGHARAEAREPFDLRRAPLLRAALLRLDPRDHVVLLTLHHIVSDAASVGVLLRELAALYGALAEGRPSPLPPLPVQYADFAAWQRARLRDDVVAEQLEFWRERLGGELPVLELPRGDAPPGAGGAGEAAMESLPLAAPLAGAVRALAREEGTTPFTVLLAAFHALLHRYTGQADVLSATAVANRERPELEGLIGCFVNTVVLRTPVSGDPAFRAWLREVRATVQEAFAHAEVPLEQVVRALGPGGPERRAPAGVMFVHRAVERELRPAPGLSLRPFPVPVGGETFDLTVTVAEEADGMLVQATFGADRFEAAAVRRLLGHFAVLLGAAAADPERGIGELPLLGPGEREALRAVNRTEAPYPDVPVHERVEAQVRRTPDAVAAEWGDERLTYAEVNRRANRLAHLLRARGVRADGRVGLCLERSPEMVVGVLGILKAGAACVPLDPAYPAERLAAMLEDAGAGEVVTRAPLLGRLPCAGGGALCVDRDAEALAAMPAGDPASGASADTLCYVIFTSGSTGRPKGVGVPHRTLANLLAWQHAQPEYARGARTLQFSTLGFDASFQEIFSTWTTGGTLVLVPEETQRDAARWVPLLREARVERLFCPFVALRQVAELVDGGAPLPESLREVLPAGEQLQVTPAVVRLFERLPGRSVHNLYGPTETHVVTAHTLSGDPGAWPALPPIGRPVWNTRVHVLDARLQPVPAGVAGELYLGGHNLARGYLGRPDLTAERFVPDPFAPAPGERLYRTGDRARFRADGSLDFLGRADDQVKVRGFRVEPGEVEATLALHPAVRGAVVTALPDAGAGRRLVAHVVAGEPVTVTGLREFLEARVPAYMVPAAWVFLERFPLLPSGKTDRRALPLPDAARPALAQPYAPPRTHAERTLAGVWSGLLGVDPVGIHDGFLELGGDSILGIQAVARARRLGVGITLRQLFDLRTVAALASAAVPVDPSPGTEPAAPPASSYPLTPMQEGILFHSLLAPGEGEYVEHVHCTWGGPFRPDAFRRAWERLVERHPALRTTFRWEGVERPLQVVHPRGELRIERGGPDGVEAYLRAEEGRRFDPAVLPLMHLAVFPSAGDAFDFVWSFHDLVLDGWSAEAVLGEFRALYAADPEAAEPDLPARLPFAAYVAWREAQPPEPAREFWRRELAGVEALVPLPAPLAPPEPAARAYRRERARTAPGTGARLREGARRHGVTPADAVLAAWALLLSRLAGEEEVAFGSVVSGRSAGPEGVDAVVGVLVNTLPVRARVEPGRPLAEWVAALAERARRTREWEHAPLAEIRRLAGTGAGTPLFGSILDVVNHPGERGDGRVAHRWSMQKTGHPLFVVAQPDGEPALEITHRTADHDGASVRRMLGWLVTLLEGMAERLAAPDAARARVDALPWLDAAERRQLLEEWNRTGVELPPGGLAERLRAQAARSPGATAAVCGGRRMGYGELVRRADALALALADEGVGPETVVALLAERGLDFWLAALGVLLAGGAYLPLDPAHPAARHRQVLEGSRAPLLVASGALRGAAREAVDALDPAARPRLLPLEALPARPRSGAALPPPPEPEGLAYVIYTSGSTGAPKGAMVEHRGMMNHLHAKLLELDIGPGDRVAQTASQCFDISVWQFLAALLVGGETHVVPDEVAHDPAALARATEDAGITVLETVPSLMRVLLDELRSPRGASVPLGALRWMIPTGEALPPELAREWLEAYPRVPLLNAYGPTECSDDVTHHPVRRPPAPGTRHMPIGRPVANARLYVVDAGLDPVAAGVAGELLVGGVCVGRGYARDPERTADAFVPDPFGGDAGARLYRTGDRVRLLPDGGLEYLGRTDHQVKVRGFRIEPGEVEAVLLRHPAVRQAAVVARETGHGGRRLVAYLAVGAEESPSAAELRAHLGAALPEYMVPAAFVAMDALPLNANGKLDRRSLPEPDEAAPSGDAAYRAPEGDAERRLAGVWAELLGVERVGREDDFFALGGDSILAIQVASRARREGLLLTPRDVFRHPGLAELAAAAGRGTRVEAEQGPVVGEVPPTPVQRGFLEEGGPDPHHFNQAVLLRAEAPLSAPALARAARALASHHDALRLRFRGGRAWIAPPGESPFVHLELSAAPGAAERASAELQGSLCLEGGPLVRVALLDSGPGIPARVLLVAHHLAVDAVSWRVLLEDLHAAYAQAAAGAEPRLPPRTTSFREWAERLRAHAASPAVGAEAEFWLEQARPAGAPLPLDHPGAPDTVAEERVVVAALGAEETRALLHDAPRAHAARVDEVLLAAVAAAVLGWTGEDTLRVELEGHGRAGPWDDVDLSRTVGWFTAVYPVRLERPAAGGPADALRAVRDRLRSVPANGIGYGLLRHLAPSGPAVEELRRLPPAEVLFNYLGQLDPALPEGSPFRPAAEGVGPLRSPRAPRAHRIEVNAYVREGRLHAAWAYGAGVHDAATVQALAAAFLGELRALLEDAAPGAPASPAPGEFADFGWGEGELGEILAAVEKELA